MDVKVFAGKLQESGSEAVVVGVYAESVLAMDGAIGDAVKVLVDRGDFEAGVGDAMVLYVENSRVIVTGLGPAADCDAEVARRAAAAAYNAAAKLNISSVTSALLGAGEGGLSAADSAYATAEGALMAAYTFTLSTLEPVEAALGTFDVALEGGSGDGVEQAIMAAKAVNAGVALTRDLVNTPANICNPAYMAETAVKIADEVGLRVQILEQGQMQALGMGSLLGVAQGSDSPPRLIVLEHNADRAAELDTIVLVGKGITFDTGGYSLKSVQGMYGMKSDMAGAGAVLGAMRAIGALDVPLHVVGLAPAVENMVNGHAYRPEDVITASNGVTIEIVSTDAEGRLILADALVFAKRYNPAAVIDIATLTGACVTALGKVAAGLFCTDDVLQEQLLAAADSTQERLWPLPLYEEYNESLESLVADLKNSAGKPGTGVGVAAMFLKRFVDYPVWAHIDMAGMAVGEKANGYRPKGASGYGVRLFVDFVQRWAKK